MSFECWALSRRSNSLGLSCSGEGLFLGQTALLQRTDQGFAPRGPRELERLLSRAYRAPVSVDERMPGLATVAKALNRGDLSLARIAAVHLRLPALPDAIAKLELEFQDLIIELEGKGSPLLRKARLLKEWDPEQHPRLGGPPNAGWFASTDGSDNSGLNVRRLKLAAEPGGERIDELEDLAEWIANARHDEQAAIRAEIKRQFYDVGDIRGGEALNRALSDVLEAGDDLNERQEILNGIDSYTRIDPREMAGFQQSLVAGALLGVPAGVSQDTFEGAPLSIPEEAPPLSPTPNVWKLGWAARGRIIEQAQGANLEPSFPVIDKFVDGTVTSIKSVDLNAATYQHTQNLVSRIGKYVDQLAEFGGASWGRENIESAEIKDRVLELVVPRGSVSPGQRAVINELSDSARSSGVRIRVIEYKE